MQPTHPPVSDHSGRAKEKGGTLRTHLLVLLVGINGLMQCDQVSGRCGQTGIKSNSIRDEKDAALRVPEE